MGYTDSEPELQAYQGPMPIGSQGQPRIDIGGLDWSEMASPDWTLPESYTLRKTDGVPRRVDCLKALGNAVVPQVAEYLGALILARDAIVI